MSDITTIKRSELEYDLLDSQEDIKLCVKALLSGVREWSGGSVESRLNANRGFVKKITAELKRRDEL